MQGGTGSWATHVDLARSWLSRLSIVAYDGEKPDEAFSMMSEADQLAAKMTMVSGAVSRHGKCRC